MSWQAVTWVLEKSQAAGFERLVLLSIASHANREGDKAWPAVDTIAKETRMSTRSVQRCLRKLEASGEVVTESVTGQSNRYSLPHVAGWLNGTANSRPVSQSGVTAVSPGGDKGVVPGATAVSPEPSFELVSEPSKPKPSSANRADGVLLPILKRVWDYYISKLGKNPSVVIFTEARKAKGRTRLRESLERTGGNLENAEALMKLAIDALATSSFHLGDNDRKTRYDSWEKNLFNSAEQYERWLERA